MGILGIFGDRHEFILGRIKLKKKKKDNHELSNKKIKKKNLNL